MATVVDICNLALSRLGDEASVSAIDPPDGSAQATHCARFYNMALNAILDEHYWSFATVRAALVQLSATPAFGWQYAYAEPNNVIDTIGVYLPGALDDKNPQEFECEALADGTSVIYTNVQSAVVRYTMRATDPAKYPPLFVEALVWLLASHLAGPVIKGMEGIKMTQSCYQAYVATLSRAKASDAAQRKVRLQHNPDFLKVRGTYPPNASDDSPGTWSR